MLFVVCRQTKMSRVMLNFKSYIFVLRTFAECFESLQKLKEDNE